MSSYELFMRLPILPMAITLIAVVAFVTFNFYLKNRHQKGLAGQIALYSFLVVLFLIDFFLILKRDGFRSSWTLTVWMALAAFIVGERVGRWTSGVSVAEKRETLSEPGA
jgi:hypothetical protein